MNARRALLVAGAMMVAGCVGGRVPPLQTPPPALPDRFSYAPDRATGDALDALIPAQDPAYVALSAQALAASPTLGEALARIEQARALADRAKAERLPAVGAGASVTGARSNPAQFSATLPPGVVIDSDRVSYAGNVTARWDPDLFGRLRAQQRAALARIDAADASANAVRLAMLSEIAVSVIDWRTLDARAVALRQDLASADGLARLSGVRERAGLSPGFDRVRAESAAASARSRLASLESERVRLIGRLVALTAQPASAVRTALSQPGPTIIASVAPPPTLPSQLLTNRPDVAAAAARLAADDAELAATARRRFPTFDLTAGMGLLAFGLGDLFDSRSIIGSLASTIAGPLLDFGRIQAEIDGAAAGKKASFEAYRAVVFTALGDAEAAYGLITASDAEALAAAAEAASLQRAAAIAETRQRAGLADFRTVLDARRAADASGERAATAKGRSARARVLLWQALGGSVGRSDNGGRGRD